MNIKTKIDKLEKRIDKMEGQIKMLLANRPQQNIFGDLITDSIKQKMQQMISKKLDDSMKDDGLGIERSKK